MQVSEIPRHRLLQKVPLSLREWPSLLRTFLVIYQLIYAVILHTTMMFQYIGFSNVLPLLLARNGHCLMAVIMLPWWHPRPHVAFWRIGQQCPSLHSFACSTSLHHSVRIARMIEDTEPLRCLYRCDRHLIYIAKFVPWGTQQGLSFSIRVMSVTVRALEPISWWVLFKEFYCHTHSSHNIYLFI